MPYNKCRTLLFVGLDEMTNVVQNLYAGVLVDVNRCRTLRATLRRISTSTRTVQDTTTYTVSRAEWTAAVRIFTATRGLSSLTAASNGAK